jgi:tRNA pseudouridine55 synthase
MDGEILNLYKSRGETPLQRIDRFRMENPEYEDVTLSYAGRLDPMAEGVLIVLAGNENKNRENYLKYSKEYVFDALFGVHTDTYDILGKVIDEERAPYDWQEMKDQVILHLAEFKGRIMQHYPPYSSKPVKGIPLFEWARKNKLTEIDIPKKEIEIFEIIPVALYTVSRDELSQSIFETITEVKGDFRQKAIIKSWIKFFEETDREEFHLLRIKIICSSGTYVRGVVNALGKKVGIGALAFRIIRTKVGTYKMEDSLA